MYFKQFLGISLLVLGFNSNVLAQPTICLGTDATVCIGSSITIEDCANFGGGTNGSTSPYIEGQIPYAPDPWNQGTPVNLSDDAVSGALPIGFNFCFFGNTYNQFYIGSNGWISFSPGQSTSFTSGPIPNTAPNIPKDCIMGPWQDWHPGIGNNVGQYIRYQTLGTAPNRRMVVSWNAVPMFSCTTTYGTFQIIIYETTNIIETHIQNKPACTQWAGGTATHGLHNIVGNFAYVVPGRNSTQWITANEGWRFTPGAIYEWANTLGQTFPYNGGILPVTNVQAGTVGYFLEVSGTTCAQNVGTPSDTSWITGVSTSVSVTGTDDLCSASQGTATATVTSGTGPFTYNWPSLGNNPNPTVTNLPTGNYTVQVSDSYGCTATGTIFIDDTPAAFSGSSTLITCAGGGDGTAYAEMIPPLGNITYQWDDPNMQTTQTATGLAAGQYTCTITSDIGCQGIVIVDVNEIPALTGVISSQSDVTCNSGNDGVIQVTASQGTAPYTYAWDNSVSTTNIANDLYAGTHTVTITDANNCSITVTGTIGEPTPLSITFLTPNTQICPEDDIDLNVTGSGGSSPYTFTWSSNGSVIGTGSQITVDPTVTNTEYCVVLSEACGSPTDEQCTIITFPTPIEPSAVPNYVEQCVPNTFEFTNTSSNGGEIATTVWDFGSVKYFTTELGNDSTSFFFNDVGTYDLIMTTTSIYGCVYADTIESIIEVLPIPTADFFFSKNPTTIFETSVFMQDKSSSDVINWYWDSPGSNPTSSNLVTPTFLFPDGIVGEYPITLIVETELGCTDTITYFLNVVEDILFYAPNTFTPDGDEFNQNWQPIISGIDIYDFDLFIFNRWGELIWESHDPNVGWDGTYKGKPVQDGTYTWFARVSTEYNDDKKEFNGAINLIR